MAQFRLVDVAKRQLKTPPDARDVSWSIRKREILAKHKVRFATQPDEREMAYYNLKRKHVIGFDRLASRLPSRGIGAHQNDNDIINRLVYRTIAHKTMLGPNTKELQKESNIAAAYTRSIPNRPDAAVEEVEALEAAAEDRNDMGVNRYNIDQITLEERGNLEDVDGYIAEQAAALEQSFAQSSLSPKGRTYTKLQREAHTGVGASPSVSSRIETDKKNEMTVLRNRAYASAEVTPQPSKPKAVSLPLQFAVGNRGVTTSGLYNPNDRKIRKTKTYKDPGTFDIGDRSLFGSPVLPKQRKATIWR